MATPIETARWEIADAIGVAQTARSLDPSLEDVLAEVDTGLTQVRDRLDAQLESPAPERPGDSLYSAVQSADASPWEAALTAVMTLQIHVKVAKDELFGDEEEGTRPAAGLSDADDLRQAFATLEGSLDSARARLRERAS